MQLISKLRNFIGSLSLGRAIGVNTLAMVLLTASSSMAQATKEQPAKAQPSKADTKKIQAALEQGKVNQAISEIRKLPLAERMAWIDSLAESRSSSSTSSGSTNSSSGSNQLENGKDQPGNHGGAAGANFGPLMQLIQQTISPDDWVATGGNNTMTPFQSGVWIDTKGIVQERTSQVSAKAAKAIANKDKNAKTTDDLIVIPNVGSWQTGSDLRWISLTKLEQRLKDRAEKGHAASASMELLGGLARIDYVAWNADSREWLLGGPAGNFAVDRKGELVHKDLGLPPVLLEDLLSVAPHLLGNRADRSLGCSIDPVADRLPGVQKYISDPASVKRLSRDPAKFTSELVEKIGPQQVSILGLPKDSPTGLALLVADQHMKRIGLGLEPAPRGMRDYIQTAEKLDAVPGKGLVRWWFAFQNTKVETDASETMFVLPKNAVCVLSDKEWMDATGNRNQTVERDRAADEFAKTFSDRFDDLQKMYPVYGRLRHIFDLSIAMELIHRNGKDRDPLSYLAQTTLQPHMMATPEFVPSVSTHRVLASKQSVAIVSGGVVVSPTEISQFVGKDPSSLPSTRGLIPGQSEGLDWMLEGKR